jgi:hypothetical protein
MVFFTDTSTDRSLGSVGSGEPVGTQERQNSLSDKQQVSCLPMARCTGRHHARPYPLSLGRDIAENPRVIAAFPGMSGWVAGSPAKAISLPVPGHLHRQSVSPLTLSDTAARTKRAPNNPCCCLCVLVTHWYNFCTNTWAHSLITQPENRSCLEQIGSER